jgi:hypothetical protein
MIYSPGHKNKNFISCLGLHYYTSCLHIQMNCSFGVDASLYYLVIHVESTFCHSIVYFVSETTNILLYLRCS